MAEIQSTSLRRQVYEILRRDLRKGRLCPDDPVRLDEMAERLGISRTPLREALLQLELEGFVVIKPRSGIRVRRLTEADIRNLYQLIGALEASVLEVERPRLGAELVSRMRQLNDEMMAAVKAGDFDSYYAANLALHDAYLDLSRNAELVRQVRVMKQRLYDFTPRRDILQDWEEESTREHDLLVSALERGELEVAARLVREVHWSYSYQERFIRKYYLPEMAADASRDRARS